MTNVVTPKLSGVGSGVFVKTYQYGGSTTSMEDSKSNYDYEAIDYSGNLQNGSNTYKENHWYDNLGQKTGAFLLSTASSLTVGIAEQVSDGVAMLVGGAISKVAKWFGKDEFANNLEKKIQTHVEKRWAEDLYNDAAEFYGIDYDIAHGGGHVAGHVVGTIAGYVAIGVLSGGASTVVMPVAGGLSAAGNAGQKAFDKGATFNQALANSAAAGAVGAASGAAMSGIGNAARGVTNGWQAAGLTVAGAGVGAATPGIQSVVEYNTYEKDNYSSYNEFAKETGVYKSMAIGATIGGVTTGVQAGMHLAATRKIEKQWDSMKTVQEKDKALKQYDRWNQKGHKIPRDQLSEETSADLVDSDDAYFGYKFNEKGDNAKLNGTVSSDKKTSLILRRTRRMYTRDEYGQRQNIQQMADSGDIEGAAREANAFRNQSKLDARDYQRLYGIDTGDIEARNIQKYGNPLGPTFEQSVNKCMTEMGITGDFDSLPPDVQQQVYQGVIDSAFSPNPSVNAACDVPENGKWW